MTEIVWPAGALDAALSVIGKIGSGKTYAAKGAVEILLGLGRRVCIIDPLGVWHGLRTTSDGERPAFPVVIFGGDHADVPLPADGGETLGRLIADGVAPTAIIDTSDLTGGETTRLLTPFFETLFARNREALHLILDEADAFAPQNPMPGAERLKGVVDKIARRGRVKGFRLMTITQRPAVLDKSVLSQVSTLVAMSLTSPQDRKAIEGWVKGNADEGQAKAVLDSLSKLQRGEGWIWSPGADVLKRVTFPRIATLDTSRTPEPGERIVSARAAAIVDIDVIRKALQAVQVDEKISGGAGATAAHVEAAEKCGYERGFEEGLKRGELSGIAKGIARARLAIDAIRIDTADAAPAQQFAPAIVARSPKSQALSQKSELNSAALKLLAVLDTNPPVRRTWTHVATLAGLKARGGHFNVGRKALIDSALIAERDGLVSIITPTKDASAPTSDPAALVEIWASNLSGAAPKVLRHLFDAGPQQKEEIAANLAMQPRGGHWNAAWKELRDNHIVEEANGTWRLTDLFRSSSTGTSANG